MGQDPSGGEATDPETATDSARATTAIPVETTPESTPGKTPNEAAALRRARVTSDVLDDAVAIPGTDVRVGLDPVLGLVSGGGDAVAALLSLHPVLEAYRLGAPRRTLAKMLALVAVDFVAGSIPIVGTLFDTFWRANRWNVQMLERHVEGQ